MGIIRKFFFKKIVEMLSSFKILRMFSKQATFRTFATATVARVPDNIENINVNASINEKLKNTVESAKATLNSSPKQEVDKMSASTKKPVIASPKQRLVD